MRSIASLINEILSDGSLLQPSPLALLERAWPGAVGEELRVLTRILDLEDGFLIVESMHPAALFEVRSREGELMERLRSETGVPLRAIRIRPAGRRS